MRKIDTTRPLFDRRALVVVLLSAVLFILCFCATPAAALGITDVTASSNESGGNRVLGGKPTRITWTAVVDKDETVKKIHLTFPEGSTLSDTAEVRLTYSVNTREHPENESESAFTSATDETTAKKDDGPSAGDWRKVEPVYNEELSPQGLTLSFSEGLESGNQIIVMVYGLIFPNFSADYIISSVYTDDKGDEHLLPDSDPISVVNSTPLQGVVDWLKDQEWVTAWNSNKFLNSFFNPIYAVSAVPTLFAGWGMSLALVALGFPLAIPLGLGISFLRMSRLWILRFISSIYVNVIRGTPLFLQIYIAFFGLPLFIPGLNIFVIGFVVLALNSSAYLAEIFRAGIQSIHKGQFEASASLGMNAPKTMFFVIIPQTIRRVIPTMTSEFILLFKDTSLLAAVGFWEMMMYAKFQATFGANLTPYVVAAGFYLLVTLPLTRIITVFEKKLAATDGRTSAPEEKKTKRVGLFKTVALVPATDSDPGTAISSKKHGSQ